MAKKPDPKKETPADVAVAAPAVPAEAVTAAAPSVVPVAGAEDAQLTQAAQQDNAAPEQQSGEPQGEVAPPPVVEAAPPAPEPEPVVAELPVFIRQHEDAAARRGAELGQQIVVVAISHPAADESQPIYSGRDGGIRMSRGAAGAVYSDGSKHTTP